MTRVNFKLAGWLALVGVTGWVGTAAAQEGIRLQQPSSVFPIAYEYYDLSYQNQKPSPSPSDVPMKSPSDRIAMCDSACGSVAEATCSADAGCCDANDCCRKSCCLGDPWELTDGKCGPKIGGWLQGGYHSANNLLGFNQHDNDLRLHQGWLYIEKALNTCDRCSWDFGYRADLVYGVDAQDTQAFGGPAGSWDNSWDNGIYGWALPQLYGEIGRGDLSVKFGKFFTIVGYEVVTAPDNFFYSHAFTMYNSEPFTHTGVLATYTASDRLTLYGGWIQGWDTGFSALNDGNALIGGAGIGLTDDATLTYIFTAGRLGARGDGYSHSLVLDVNVNSNLNYVFQSDLVNTDGGVTPGVNDDQVGINQYLFYTLSDCWAVGGRAEWWKSDGTSFYAMTGGVNYRPHANIVIRPEIRYNWSPSAAADAANFDDNTQLGIDAIITF